MASSGEERKKFTPDNSIVKQVLVDQRKKFRTTVTPKAYIYPHVDALDDMYCTLLGDIKMMKASNPVPQEVLDEAEEELKELKKSIEKAGFVFYS